MIAGVLAVVAFRRKVQESVQSGLESSAERLQSEMQRSADEIILRLNERIDQLERLVEDADQRSAQLEWQLARMKDHDQEFTPPEMESDLGSSKLSGPESDFSQILQESLTEAEYTIENEPIRTVRAMNAYGVKPRNQRAMQGGLPAKSVEERRKPEFTLKEEYPSEEAVALAPQVVDEALPMTAAAESEASAAMSELVMDVRDLVHKGYPDEAISRQVHLSRRAIELIRQMDFATREKQG